MGSGLNPSIVWNITWHERGTPFFLGKYIVGLPVLWQVWHLWCLFYPSFSPLCVSASPSVLPHWAVLLRLKYWSLLRLTLSWQSICHIESLEKPLYFLPIKFRWPLLFYFFSVFATTFYHFMTQRTRRIKHLKKLLEWFLCYIHCYLVYKLKQPFNRVKLHHNSQLHSGSLEL